MRYFLALLLTLTALPSIAKADVLPDNMHPITNCIAVANIADYPDYDFVWQIEGYRGMPSSEKIVSAEPVCDVGGSYSLLAIKQVDWNKVMYRSGIADESGDPAEQWTQDPRNAELFITSNYSVSFERFAPNTSDVQNVYTTVSIDSVTDTGVTAHTASTLSTDGNSEPISTDDTGNSELTTLAKVLIALGLVGVGYVAFVWKKK